MPRTRTMRHGWRAGALVAALALAGAARAQAPAAPTLPMAAAASWGTVVVDPDGSVTAWPDQADGQPVRMALPRKAVGAAVHQSTAFFLLEDGTVMGVGRNSYQSLGRPGGDAATPVPIPGLRDIVQITATYDHALALRRDGAVFAWGEEVDGLRGDAASSHAPVTRVPGLPPIVQIATAARHSLALGQDGRVYAWGANSQGELGRGVAGESAPPAPTPGLEKVVAIAAGFKNSLAVTQDGAVWAWGSNQSAMLGDGGRGGSASEGYAVSPARVPGVAGARQVAAGEGFALARLADGSVRAWGFDGYGEIGVGTAGGYHTSPTRIPSLAKVVGVNAGGYRVFATTADGRLWHWGTPIPVAPGRRPNVKTPAVLDH
ncbi:hypothetical protein [Phenylobacterium sp.]|uniref:RCC1 domain-containing protein n=1 Tax=Phenylobacterium sp. TaxID=1871053 RepID=UPI0025E8435C|nr:hypothetical protein [Phenylobacterium sp.]